MLEEIFSLGENFHISSFKVFEYFFEVKDINANFIIGYYLFLRNFDDEKV